MDPYFQLVLRPTVHAEELDPWINVLGVLGGTQISDDPLWTEFDMGRGRIALSRPIRGAVSGEIMPGFEVADLAKFERFARAAGVDLDWYRTDSYTSLKVRFGDRSLLVDQLMESSRVDNLADVSVWCDVRIGETAARTLEAMGMRNSTRVFYGGSAAYLAGVGGVVVLPVGEPLSRHIVLDVDDVKAETDRLIAAGFGIERSVVGALPVVRGSRHEPLPLALVQSRE
ncbi:hypothetical protein [Rudaeicoccus suwonensis]|nr:hypothetical protein [Rudaeicoccus suwonensis]